MKQNLKKLLALTLTALLLCALLTGCGAKQESSAVMAAATGEAAPMAPEYALDAPAEAPPPASEDAALATGGGAATVADPSQKIIYNAYLYVETTAFDDAVAAVEQLTRDFGGFLERANVDGRTETQSNGATRVVDRSACYVVRVPADKYTDALKQAGTIGSVTSSSQSTENITSQFIDNEARRDSLAVQEKRLLAMLEKTTDMESLVALESRLSEVRYEIESIERQLRNWQTMVDYSTIELNLREVAVYTPTTQVQATFGERLSTAFGDGVSGLERGVQSFTLWLVRALPTLVLLIALAAVALAVTVIVRSGLRKRRAKSAPPEAEPEDSSAKDK